MLVSDGGAAGIGGAENSGAILQRALGLLWGHVSHSETSHPEMYSPDKGRMESVRLFIWRGH